jgi:hypothetical protein
LQDEQELEEGERVDAPSLEEKVEIFKVDEIILS